MEPTVDEVVAPEEEVLAEEEDESGEDTEVA